MSKFNQKPAGILNHVDLKGIKGKAVYWLFFSILVLAAIITFVPAIWMVLTAFKTTQEIYSAAHFIPMNFSLSSAFDSIKHAWRVLDLGRSMINTLVVCIGNALCEIFVSGLAGYVLSKLRVKGTKLVFALVVWTMMMPAAIRTVPQYMSFISFPFVIDDKISSPMNINILDSYLPIWLTVAANSFNIILFKNNFDSISNSIVEAAEIDGCGNFKIFYKIMLPIAMPVVIYIAIGAMSFAWNDYFTPYIVLKDTAKLTTPAKVFMLKNDSTVTTNIYMMGLIFASIPSLLIFGLFQKYIVGGIAVGGVKG